MVISGVFKPHDQIPSIRSLAQELKLNFNTVKRAYADLEQAGVIFSLTGRGSFIAETAIDNAQLKGKAFEEINAVLKIGRTNGISKDVIIQEVINIYD